MFIRCLVTLKQASPLFKYFVKMKVAVVTGANKGIGFEIVKGLCKKFEGVVYLTARDVTRGQNAVEELVKLGYKPKFHQLDVTDGMSIETFRDHLKSNYGGLDILVNNAAILYLTDTTLSLTEQAENTTLMNYFSIVSLCDTLKPIIRDGGRIVNVSSSSGHLSRIPGKELRDEFNKKDLTTPQLSNLVRQFVDAVKAGTTGKEGWPDHQRGCYAVSKVALSALSFIQQRELASRGINVNAVHPGYIITDMTKTMSIEGAPEARPADQGAEAPLYLALEAPDNVRGVYMWHDKTIIPWDAEKTPAIC